jgi:hypothetical protein
MACRILICPSGTRIAGTSPPITVRKRKLPDDKRHLIGDVLEVAKARTVFPPWSPLDTPSVEALIRRYRGLHATKCLSPVPNECRYTTYCSFYRTAPGAFLPDDANRFACFAIAPPPGSAGLDYTGFPSATRPGIYCQVASDGYYEITSHSSYAVACRRHPSAADNFLF